MVLDSFLNVANHKLAEVIWDHQRNEGEIPFAEFLTILGPLGLSQLAVELVEEAEQGPDLTAALQSAMAFFLKATDLRELAKIRAVTSTRDEGDAMDDALKKAAEKANQRKDDGEMQMRSTT